jgi:hypothetical protein
MQVTDEKIKKNCPLPIGAVENVFLNNILNPLQESV